MTTKDLLKLSTRVFTARKGRTTLTILGLGIGFGVILFLVSLGYGLQNALVNTITTAGALTTLDVAPNEQEGHALTPAASEGMKKIGGVEGIETSYEFGARAVAGGTAVDTRVVVATPGYLDLEGLKVASGESLSEDSSKGIVVTSVFGKIAGKNPEELIGEDFSFVLSTDGEALEASGFAIAGVAESEETVFYVLAQEGLGISPDTPYSKIKVKCESSEVMDSVKDVISSEGFSVSSLSETVSEVDRLFRILNIILGLFGIVTLVVSAIGMFNTMTVALLERTREIGIMRSIGASRWDILAMFVIESTLMGFCGGVAGIAIGIVAGQGMNLVFNLAAGHFGGKSLNLFAYPIWFLATLLLSSIAIGFATGIGPARRASGLDPLEALRRR